jgi:dienelactone hydrolase
VAGWNGEAADAYADVRWALDRIRAEHGDVPVVLVGHSMGGRAALRAGGEDGVRTVCALAPWTPPGEPVDQLQGQTVAILHGRGDRWVPAALSADYAVRAADAGAYVARFTIAGGHSMLRRANRWHTFVRGVVLAGAGLEPMPLDVAEALRRPVPQGLAVPL